MHSMTLRKHNAYAIVSIAILSIVTGCASGSSVIRDFCQLYRPVYVSRSADFISDATRSAIDGNNAVWLEKCGP